jgi:hypothetical protein
MKQGDTARAEVYNSKCTIVLALKAFSGWLENVGKNDEVWGNGADFDNLILANAYAKCCIEQPWSYRKNRCYRTLKNMYPEVQLEQVGTAHHALCDAETQALHLIQIFNKV